MRVLILGGTVFLGRHIVDACLARAYDVTLFNRGQSNPELFPDLPRIRGDRTVDVSAIGSSSWDSVIDVAGYVPRVVRMSAGAAARVASHYTFISTISVYESFSQPGMDETAPIGTLDDEGGEAVTGETYGPLKALCERAAAAASPGRTLVIRPGLIVGPHDPTDRFTYWPWRVARGGEVLAPERPGCPVQFIDVRDLAEFTVRMIEQRVTGTYNATGPAEPLTLGELLDTCREATDSDARFTYIPERFLKDWGATPWSELPLWPGEIGGRNAGFSRIECRKAIAAGLTFRPLAVTIRDTLEWVHAGGQRQLKAGLADDKEADLLERWHAAENALEAI